VEVIETSSPKHQGEKKGKSFLLKGGPRKCVEKKNGGKRGEKKI